MKDLSARLEKEVIKCLTMLAKRIQFIGNESDELLQQPLKKRARNFTNLITASEIRMKKYVNSPIFDELQTAAEEE